MKDETKCLHAGYTPKNTEAEALISSISSTYAYDADHYNITTDNVPTEFIHEHKDQITDYEFIKGTMDDVFLNLTGRELA